MIPRLLLFFAVLGMGGCSSMGTDCHKTLQSAMDAMEKQGDAIKKLEHALDVAEKQRDEFEALSKRNLNTANKAITLLEQARLVTVNPPDPKWGFDPNIDGAQVEHEYCPTGWKVEEWKHGDLSSGDGIRNGLLYTERRCVLDIKGVKP